MRLAELQRKYPLVDTLVRDLLLSFLLAFVSTLFWLALAISMKSEPSHGMPPFTESYGPYATWVRWWLEVAWALPVVIGISLGHRLLPKAERARWLGLILLCLLGGIACLFVTVAIPGYDVWLKQGMNDGLLVAAFFCFNVILAMQIVVLREFVYRNERATEALHAMELQSVEAEREVTQARLQVLHAQIEPHFLFNSLANVRRLLRTDAQAARSLLADLLRYLEEALPRLREQHTTIGSEVELVRAYLAVHQVRMGSRLSVEVDVPGSLSARTVPPLTLLTLVENALKHGLQPLPEGGSIRVAARAADGMITLSVADTGCGMGTGSGDGTGLANLRARLKAMYGAVGSLSLQLNEPHGVIATVAIPEAA